MGGDGNDGNHRVIMMMIVVVWGGGGGWGCKGCGGVGVVKKEKKLKNGWSRNYGFHGGMGNYWWVRLVGGGLFDSWWVGELVIDYLLVVSCVDGGGAVGEPIRMVVADQNMDDWLVEW